jgi:hypothetical protein
MDASDILVEPGVGDSCEPVAVEPSSNPAEPVKRGRGRPRKHPIKAAPAASAATVADDETPSQPAVRKVAASSERAPSSPGPDRVRHSQHPWEWLLRQR